MHTIHHTRAVIVKSEPSRDADKAYWLFTKELGLVIATATGVRKSHAKLKGQLVDYAFIDADLVQGREIWRLVSATLVNDPLLGNTTHPLARGYVRALATLERFLIGEGAHPELFAHIEDCAALLKEEGIGPKKFDTLAIWRILVHLGYIAVHNGDHALFEQPLADAVRALSDEGVKRLVAEVNNTIKETHL